MIQVQFSYVRTGQKGILQLDIITACSAWNEPTEVWMHLQFLILRFPKIWCGNWVKYKLVLIQHILILKMWFFTFPTEKWLSIVKFYSAIFVHGWCSLRNTINNKIVCRNSSEYYKLQIPSSKNKNNFFHSVAISHEPETANFKSKRSWNS